MCVCVHQPAFVFVYLQIHPLYNLVLIYLTMRMQAWPAADCSCQDDSHEARWPVSGTGIQGSALTKTPPGLSSAPDQKSHNPFRLSQSCEHNSNSQAPSHTVLGSTLLWLITSLPGCSHSQEKLLKLFHSCSRKHKLQGL